jgi:hypothetical protein
MFGLKNIAVSFFFGGGEGGRLINPFPEGSNPLSKTTGDLTFTLCCKRERGTKARNAQIQEPFELKILNSVGSQ